MGVIKFYINFPNPSNGITNWLAYRFGALGNKWFFGDDGTNAYFQTSHNMYFTPDVGSDPSQSKTGASLALVSGNVGIGTTSPAALLHVAAAGAGNTQMAAFTEAALPNGGYNFLTLGQAAATNTAATLSYTYNSSTAWNSYVSLRAFREQFFA